MFSRLHWLFLQLSRRLWVRATAFSVLGVVTALIALWVKRYIPDELPAKIGSDAVDSLLQIIATSMLSVMIFSLSTIVSAYASATSNTTPRATQLLMSDSTAQNALATFLGAFLFSLVGIIVLQTGQYGDNGRVVLYAVTLGVIVIIVLTLLRWTDYVLRLGRVGPTCDRVESVATKALRRRRAAPYLSGRPREPNDSGIPEGFLSIHTDKFGYVQHIDMPALQDAAKEAEIEIYLIALPGHFAGTAEPLVAVMNMPSEVCVAAIRDAFSITAARDFDQDPRFGVCVLSEIASRDFRRQSTIPAPPSTSSVAVHACYRCGRTTIPKRSKLMRKMFVSQTCMSHRLNSMSCLTISSSRSREMAQVWSKSASTCRKCCRPWPALATIATGNPRHAIPHRHLRAPGPRSP